MFYILEDIFNKWNNIVNTFNIFLICVYFDSTSIDFVLILKCSSWLSDKDESIAVFKIFFPAVFFIKEIKENVHMVKKKWHRSIYSMRIDHPPNLVL